MTFQTKLSIAYDGDDLQRGLMDVRDLSPALLAVGQLFNDANNLLNENESNIKVYVAATGAGSFEVVFEVVQTLTASGVKIFSNDVVTSIINLKEVLLIGAAGSYSLIHYIKKFKGRSPDKIEKMDEDKSKIEIDNEDHIVPNQLLKLNDDRNIRKSLATLVEQPLQKDGIDTFKVIDEDNVLEVSKEESSYFAVPNSSEDTLIDHVSEIVYSIKSLSFKEKNKWKLFDGQREYSVQICDRDFLNRVRNSEISFSNGDELVCRVRFKQFRVQNKLKSETVVEKVIVHRPANRLIQSSLNTGIGD